MGRTTLTGDGGTLNTVAQVAGLMNWLVTEQVRGW